HQGGDRPRLVSAQPVGGRAIRPGNARLPDGRPPALPDPEVARSGDAERLLDVQPVLPAHLPACGAGRAVRPAAAGAALRPRRRRRPPAPIPPVPLPAAVPPPPPGVFPDPADRAGDPARGPRSAPVLRPEPPPGGAALAPAELADSRRG